MALNKSLNLSTLLAFALVVFLGTAWGPAHAQANSVCEPLLTTADAKPDFQSLRLINVRLAPNLSASELVQVRHKIQDLGFKSWSMTESGRAWVGEVDPISAAQLSRVEGVASITRESSDGIDIWRDGKKSRLVVPEDYEPETDAQLWNGLRAPVRGTPPRDLPAIRQMAREKGVTIVISSRRPATQAMIRDIEELWGARVFFAGDLTESSSLVEIPGVVLHIEPSPKSLEVQGELNILLGKDKMLGKLNKVTESYWVRAIDPNAMAPALRASELLLKQGGSAYSKQRRKLNAQVRRFLQTRDFSALADIQQDTQAYLSHVIEKSNAEYESGAFIKGKDDYATREGDAIFTTGSMQPGKMALEYIKKLRSFVEESKKRTPIEPDRLDLYFRDDATPPAVMTHNLIMHPEDVLIQQKLDIAKTDADNLMEFRVDVFDGHVVNSSFRYGLEYFPEEAQGAGKMVQRFFNRAPKAARYFTGGLDVCMLKDGTFKIIETNPGAQSSFINAATYPISANEALSKLLGKRTPLLKKLDEIYSNGPTAQVQFLMTLGVREADGLTSIRDITKFDFLSWLRDRYLDEWTRTPTEENRKKTLRQMRKVAKLGGVKKGDDDFEAYIMARMKAYMSRLTVSD